MKMDGVSDLVNGRNEVTKQTQPSPKEIGREFVRQYYTMLSERPQDVFRFYSHESYFVHDTDQAVQGQQKIQKAIERLGYVDCKARIYTVTGTATLNNGLVIQVCGELAIGENPGRRFLQTFILCPQTPKKYYVHNDVFQWLDRAFGDSVPQQPQPNPALTDTHTTESAPTESVTIEQPSVNGHQQAPPSPKAVNAAISEEVPVAEDEEEEEEEEEVKEEEEQESLAPTELSAPPEAEITKEAIVEKPASEEFVEEGRMITPEQTIESHVPADNTPKTWAKMVGSCAAAAAPVAPAPVRISSTATAQQNPRPAVQAVQSTPASFNPQANTPNLQPSAEGETFNNTSGNYQGGHFGGDDGCKLYIGGIVRNCFPENASAPEREIRSAFEKFGPVATVNVPRRVLEGADTQRTIYAFVVMKTIEGAKNAFAASRKDRNMHFLQLKLDSFGFDGEATLSEQKGSQAPRGQSYSHRGMSRGGFNMRSGGGGRGGPRGGHGRQYAGSEYRHSGGPHPQHP